MRLLQIAALVSATTAASTRVSWKHEKASGKTALTVYDTAANKVLAHTCGSLLSADDISIDFSNVNENGKGNVTIGEATYQVRSKAATKGHPACTRIYNDAMAMTDCQVELDFKSEAVSADETDCFDDDDVKVSMKVMGVREGEPDTPPKEQVKEHKERDLEERQSFVCPISHYTRQIGDGNPHQNYFHKQLSEVINCGAAPSCSVGYEQSKSYTIGFSAGISANGWISAGFDVTKSWSTGNQYTCYGETGDDVCVWYNTAHTAYTVENVHENMCASIKGVTVDSDPFVMKSPNTANRGGGYYCVIGTCRAQGDNYWDNSGRAGGP